MKISFLLTFFVGMISMSSALSDSAFPGISGSMLRWPSELQKENYKSMETIYSHKTVSRGSDVYPLPNGTMIDTKTKVHDTQYDIDSFIDEYRISGILVIKDGKIRLEKYGLDRKQNDRL